MRKGLAVFEGTFGRGMGELQHWLAPITNGGMWGQGKETLWFTYAEASKSEDWKFRIENGIAS